jgi:integrase
LPRFTNGDHLFSTTFGKKPVSGFSKAKARLDKMMTEDLGSSPAAWVIHDIRRTVRTRLASLRVPDMVAEMVIGHGRKGLQRVYDQHGYDDEMREALEQWAGKLRSIVEPPPANVVELRVKA